MGILYNTLQEDTLFDLSNDNNGQYLLKRDFNYNIILLYDSIYDTVSYVIIPGALHDSVVYVMCM